jgi:hypothetical protein
MLVVQQWQILHTRPAVDYNPRRKGKRQLASRSFMHYWRQTVLGPRTVIERHFAWIKRYFGLKWFQFGIMGHSYGGNTVLFHAALDERIRFACSSGAACTYRHKLAHQYGIEMAEVIPGFAARFDIQDLVMCMAPRHVLVVSAADDAASGDADAIVTAARPAWAALGAAERLDHARYQGTHAVTQERFNTIVDWLAACSRS